MIHECRICGKQFETNYKNVFTCSPECWKTNKRNLEKERADKKREQSKEVVNCPECGTEFVRFGKRKVCCSKECQKKRDKRMTAEGIRRYRESCDKIKCIICGKSFLRSKNSIEETCSLSCYIEHEALKKFDRKKKPKYSIQNISEKANIQRKSYGSIVLEETVFDHNESLHESYKKFKERKNEMSLLPER